MNDRNHFEFKKEERQPIAEQEFDNAMESLLVPETGGRFDNKELVKRMNFN